MNPNDVHEHAIRMAMGLDKSSSEVRSEVEANLKNEIQSLTNLVTELKELIHDQKIEIRVLRSLIK